MIRYGYGSTTLSRDDLNQKWSWYRLHPEVQRRLLALFRDSGYVVGVGQGARNPVRQLAEFKRRHTTTYLAGRPSRTFEGVRYWLLPGMASYAPPGSSNHEDGVVDGYAVAADLVGWEDGWVEKVAGKYGLKTFRYVNSEPWHVQPAEMPNSRSQVDTWVSRGGQLTVWPLPQPEPLQQALSGETMKTISARVLDTREDAIPVPSYEIDEIDLTIFGVPANAKGVLLNVTPVSIGNKGFVQVDADIRNYEGSDANAVPRSGEATPNLVVSSVDEGIVEFLVSAPMHLVVDLKAYWV